MFISISNHNHPPLSSDFSPQPPRAGLVSTPAEHQCRFQPRGRGCSLPAPSERLHQHQLEQWRNQRVARSRVQVRWGHMVRLQYSHLHAVQLLAPAPRAGSLHWCASRYITSPPPPPLTISYPGLQSVNHQLKALESGYITRRQNKKSHCFKAVCNMESREIFFLTSFSPPQITKGWLSPSSVLFSRNLHTLYNFVLHVSQNFDVRATIRMVMQGF